MQGKCRLFVDKKGLFIDKKGLFVDKNRQLAERGSAPPERKHEARQARGRAHAPEPPLNTKNLRPRKRSQDHGDGGDI